MLWLAHGTKNDLRIPTIRVSPELQMIEEYSVAATVCTPYVDACNNDTLCKRMFYGVCDHN